MKSTRFDKPSVLSPGVSANGLIWMGAAVSIAEIEAGCSMGGNWAALIAGHLFGGLMLFAAGCLGAFTAKNAMASTALTFGPRGMRFFAILNIIQLIGWTAVMIAKGGEAALQLTGHDYMLPFAALASLIGVWLFLSFGDRLHLAAIAMGTLALLALALTFRLILQPGTCPAGAQIGFWPAFEISAAMPLSWLPIISDYTSCAARGRLTSAVCAAAYTLVSMWMYGVGMLFMRVGATSVAEGIVKTSVGTVGLAVVIFSTATSTFLDAFSAGESAKSIFPSAQSRPVGLGVCALGGVLALMGVMAYYIDFLYFISGVFAPMVTVLLADRFIVRRNCVKLNCAAWLAGFVAYRLAGASPIGPTLTAVAVSLMLALSALLFCPHQKGVLAKRR